MNTTRFLNRLLSFIPLVWVLGFITMVARGYLILHKIPEYGVDPDPYALHIDWINTVMLFAFAASLFAISIIIFFTITFIVKKVQFTKVDMLSIIVSLVSILIFFLCKYEFTNLFNWVLD